MANLNIQPLADRLLVKRTKKTQSKGGILLPDSAQEKPKEGEVVAVGPGKYDEEGKLQKMEVHINDRVLFGAYSGIEVKTDNQDGEYLILSQEEILGIVKSSPNNF